jgi:hypothetical protein
MLEWMHARGVTSGHTHATAAAHAAAVTVCGSGPSAAATRPRSARAGSELVPADLPALGFRALRMEESKG